MIINYNVWKIFFIIVASALITFSALLYFSFNNIEQRHDTEVKHYASLISKTVHAKFLQNEIMLEIIGRQLLENDNYKDLNYSREFLDALLQKNPYLAAFGLVDGNGNIIAASSNIKIQNKINLLENNKAKDDFKKVLSSKEMLVGRTYYFPAVKEWVIPLRKAIYDDYGNILGVMTSGLKNSKNNNYLDSIKLSKNKNIVIFLDSTAKVGLYRIYFGNAKNISSENLYSTPVPSKIYQAVLQNIKQKYNYDIDDLRKQEVSVSFESSDILGNDNITALIYDKNYKLWIMVDLNQSAVWDEFFESSLIYTALFVIVTTLFFLLFRNIATSEKRKKNELVFQAEHDNLTKLPNRTYLYVNIDEWLAKHSEKFYVIYIDLDNFKNINDKFGHTIGDKILIEVAARLQSFFNEDDMLIRQGGDEFIVFTNYYIKQSIEDVFTDLIDIVSKIYHVDNKEFRIGMSVGASVYPDDAKKVEELLSLADTAMYEAKKRKNSYCLFSEDMRHKTIVRTDIEQELRGAIEKNELWMMYQPQINADGTIYGVEALVRWENKKLGFVGPDKFISVAEDTGLIREIGDYIIKTSLDDIKTIHAELDLEFSLSINISVVQLLENDFLEVLLKHLDNIDFKKTLLTLEITESQSIDDIDVVLPLLHSIRAEGIEISLDDFGTGYSSLSTLRELPINELKIDKSFIDKILYDKNEKALVQSIINIGKNFSMKTLAEGVESSEQVEELLKANCDIFQGYFYSKPLRNKELVEFLIRKQND